MCDIADIYINHKHEVKDNVFKYMRAHKRPKDWSTVEDVIHSAFIALIKKQEEVKNPVAFLTKVSLNRLKDTYKSAFNRLNKVRIQPGFDERLYNQFASSHESPLSILYQNEKIAKYKKVFDRLPVKDRVLLRKLYDDECSQRELAEKMNVQKSAICMKVSRAMSRLRKLIDETV